MIKNNKGFMLIEVIVTSTIVVTTMIALYVSFNKLYNNYRIKNSYYNIDAMYATKEMINYSINTNNINKFVSGITYEKPTNIINDEISDDDCVVEDFSSCKNLKKLYHIKNMVFTLYSEEALNYLINDVSNQTFKDYIEYVKNYYDIESTKEDFSYMIFTEIKTGDNYYYANLRLR